MIKSDGKFTRLTSKYKKILSHLVRLDNSRSDIGLVVNNKILETGTSNLLFVKKQKIFKNCRESHT